LYRTYDYIPFQQVTAFFKKVGGLEGWKVGRLEGWPFQLSNLLTVQASNIIVNFPVT
jgi:hypothetical protein